LNSGTLDGKEILDAGGVVHRALVTLSRDLYRPAQIGTLFGSLFPGEHFNVISSPVRVHQILWRMRGWTRKTALPLEVREDRGFFSLHFGAPLCLLLSPDRRPVDRKGALLKELDSIFGRGAEFSPKEAREKLALSRATFQRLTAWGVERGLLERVGHGSAVLYRITDAA
jgi:hypothetical protein